MPWVGIPFGEKEGAGCKALSEAVPCTGFPTPGILNGTTGAVIDPDCFGKVDQANYDNWMKTL